MNDDKNLYFESKKQKENEKPGIHNDKGINPNTKKKFSFTIIYFIIMFIFLIMINNMLFKSHMEPIEIEYSTFKSMISQGQIQQVVFNENNYIGYSITKDEARATLEEYAKTRQLPNTIDKSMLLAYQTYKIDDPTFITLLDEKGVQYYASAPATTPIWLSLLSTFLPLIIFFVLMRMLSKRLEGGAQGVMSFNQNKSKIVAEGDTGVRFADVAGCEESKAELVEVVDFLKNSEKYTKIGAKIPKGVLLVGPPGTGKTLLAKAVAGEAGVPFFRMSGADFVEMFVGVGAARVRDLFKQAREKAPCIIFIDEIDAIGKQRSASLGGNDEREQTLNQLLVEMDGFDSRSGVIILAATNRAEILDPALLRPGRFDRQVLVDKPDLEGRLAILKIHSSKLILDNSVDLKKIAQGCAGLAGADLANICNEAALLAVRRNKEKVSQLEFEEAIEKSIAGLERKGRIMNESERKRVAYHETGHALTAYMTKGASPVSKISIVPRGFGALGYTLQYPTEDRFLLSEGELLGSIDVLLGGRAAEEITFGDISTGASNDISRASDQVRKMICDYGMSERFKNLTLPKSSSGIEGVAGGREYSEDTQKYIDEESERRISERYSIVLANLKKNWKALDEIAKKLLADEVIEQDEFERLAKEYVIIE
ncbi:ATP-dependent zinc metalloprotease FtsH [Bullifex porci]|uniref:ATP-dependent zinc metalloprotease FtsH n=1 Tax=Bullifex porci TaxID=2606638 RepID=UPI0023EFE27E|nr:ATP-dependent zinc metalloprotease FtsH [Bullifex porci]MDD7255227.1 ATP-dependent zinc metalloprotease FtsH [Bullifex porci]MDD7589301.1 ATP-dependent zinc metalloprotease FtsH [Bullifex porci]MDY2741918.1 ATP-dependent zinc metalloprotease FtsH [Bullifex porci]